MCTHCTRQKNNNCCNYTQEVSSETKWLIENSDSVIVRYDTIGDTNVIINVMSYSEYLEDSLYLHDNGGGVPVLASEEYARRDSLCKEKIKNL